VAHHQIYAIINPVMRVKLSEGERTPRVNRGGRSNVEASANNGDNAYTITEEEWEIARNAITNNTQILARASVGTLNAYKDILEKN
jgi:hypothetical protein